MVNMSIVKRTLALFDPEDIKYIKSKIYFEYLKKNPEDKKPKEKKLGGQYDRFRKQ